MLCNHVTWLVGLISAAGFCSQFMMMKLNHVFSQFNWYWISVNQHLIHKGEFKPI
jgi:hypothetical protein